MSLQNTGDKARITDFQKTLKAIVYRRRNNKDLSDAEIQQRKDAPLAPVKPEQSPNFPFEREKVEPTIPEGDDLTISNRVKSMTLNKHIIESNDSGELEPNGVRSIESNGVEPPFSNAVKFPESNKIELPKANGTESDQSSLGFPKLSITKTPGGILIPVGLEQPKDFSCWRCSEKGHGFETCSRRMQKDPYFCIYCGERGVSCFYCACKLGKGQYSYATPEEMAEAAWARKNHGHKSYRRGSSAPKNHSNSIQQRY